MDRPEINGETQIRTGYGRVLERAVRKRETGRFECGDTESKYF